MKTSRILFAAFACVQIIHMGWIYLIVAEYNIEFPMGEVMIPLPGITMVVMFIFALFLSLEAEKEEG